MWKFTSGKLKYEYDWNFSGNHVTSYFRSATKTTTIFAHVQNFESRYLTPLSHELSPNQKTFVAQSVIQQLELQCDRCVYLWLSDDRSTWSVASSIFVCVLRRPTEWSTLASWRQTLRHVRRRMSVDEEVNTSSLPILRHDNDLTLSPLIRVDSINLVAQLDFL